MARKGQYKIINFEYQSFKIALCHISNCSNTTAPRFFKDYFIEDFGIFNCNHEKVKIVSSGHVFSWSNFWMWVRL